MLFYGILGYGHERTGVLGNILNTHPVALKHLMPALMNFYVGVFFLLPTAGKTLIFGLLRGGTNWSELSVL